jgi:hypothetical protein
VEADSAANPIPVSADGSRRLDPTTLTAFARLAKIFRELHRKAQRAEGADASSGVSST